MPMTYPLQSYFQFFQERKKRTIFRNEMHCQFQSCLVSSNMYLLVLSEQRLAQKDSTQVQIHHTPSDTDSWDHPTVETCEFNSESSYSQVLCCVPHLFSSCLLAHGPPRRNMHLSFFNWHLLESQAPIPVHMKQDGSAGYIKGYRISRHFGTF